ncbi:Glutamate-cysteine ligase family 2(GCS2) [Fibrobacter sp. UWH5]|uniref:glutamate-cysteine ligase family protein n=1 Tax=Fibrobacter sp. UWH5 TaxID=1896211 RepID=UPI00091E921F|nr:glutamate-cysteine ligase family protein [Fibrobacter sp. UWH5]SHL14921.1 Glutamate-cysteine ligase family 2(GCS2) [Fibrobacter sp. UWH5]
MNAYKLWQKYGIEMEYMIVDRDNLNVLPRADVPLGHDKNGEQLSDVEHGPIGLSNELVSHVLELKCAEPVDHLKNLGATFHKEILLANEKLKSINAMLLPSAAHPFMDPAEMQLWPYDCNEIYETYDRIFNCKGHGWANLQSTHINLSFNGDEEFGKLHAAIRALLPLIPAIAASSPFLDGKYCGFLDGRIETYRHNQDRVPSIAGLVIPEAVFTYEDYNKQIFEKVKKDIAPHDPEHLLNHFFLNSRGAIARFDRGAVEIRLVDIQECPNADIAIAEWEVAVLKGLTEGAFNGIDSSCALKRVKALETEALAKILMDTTRFAEKTIIRDRNFLITFGIEASEITAGELIKKITSKVQSKISAHSQELLLKMFQRGTLASALVKNVGANPGRDDFVCEYGRLANCLAENTLYGVEE